MPLFTTNQVSIINYHDEVISGIGLGVRRPSNVSGTGGLLSSGSDFKKFF